ncbi:hypothetical protein [Conchiformibius steedae]|nr:hypothetical protein [Conchiformibius steedae]
MAAIQTVITAEKASNLVFNFVVLYPFQTQKNTLPFIRQGVLTS